MNRSVELYNQSTTPDQICADRVIVDYDWRGKETFECHFDDRVRELHTLLDVQKLPGRLQSLSYLAWNYGKVAVNKSMS